MNQTSSETFVVPIDATIFPVSTLQLNSKEITALNINTTDEIAPLVSAENYWKAPGKGYLRVRIVSFVSNLYSTPTIGVTNNNSTFYIQEGTKVSGTDGLYYNAWYFHFDLPTDDYLVNQIAVFHNLADPKTSRGTVTTVQSTLPPTY